jgi:hypothetical protein
MWYCEEPVPKRRQRMRMAHLIRVKLPDGTEVLARRPEISSMKKNEEEGTKLSFAAKFWAVIFGAILGLS